MTKLIIIVLMACMTCLQPCYALTDQWRATEPAEDTRYMDDVGDYVVANNNALDRVLAGYREGCMLSYASAATITVGLGEVVCSNSGGTKRVFVRNTSATTVAWANIDTGAEANSTTYYLYAIAADTDATTFTVKISASGTAPTGSTYFKRLGSFYNDASGNITKIKNDNFFAELGALESKSVDVTYQATTDGFVLCNIVSGGSISAGRVLGYTDNNAAPTTVVSTASVWVNTGAAAESTYNDYDSFCMGVKKGDYWKASYTGGGSSVPSTIVYWIPQS